MKIGKYCNHIIKFSLIFGYGNPVYHHQRQSSYEKEKSRCSIIRLWSISMIYSTWYLFYPIWIDYLRMKWQQIWMLFFLLSSLFYRVSCPFSVPVPSLISVPDPDPDPTLSQWFYYHPLRFSLLIFSFFYFLLFSSLFFFFLLFSFLLISFLLLSFVFFCSLLFSFVLFFFQ